MFSPGPYVSSYWGGVMNVQMGEQMTYDGYELFQRAIEERDEDAWTECVTRYRPLLIAWARRCLANSWIHESPEDLADQALARTWMALSPARFATFPDLAAILGYLRRCVTTTT